MSGITVFAGRTSGYRREIEIVLAEESRAPATVNDSVTVGQGGTASRLVSGSQSVLANDSDPDGLRLRVDTEPWRGPLTGH
jgi:hypothetical protein